MYASFQFSWYFTDFKPFQFTFLLFRDWHQLTEYKRMSCLSNMGLTFKSSIFHEKTGLNSNRNIIFFLESTDCTLVENTLSRLLLFSKSEMYWFLVLMDPGVTPLLHPENRLISTSFIGYHNKWNKKSNYKNYCANFLVDLQIVFIFYKLAALELPKWSLLS